MARGMTREQLSWDTCRRTLVKTWSPTKGPTQGLRLVQPQLQGESGRSVWWVRLQPSSGPLLSPTTLLSRRDRGSSLRLQPGALIRLLLGAVGPRAHLDLMSQRWERRGLPLRWLLFREGVLHLLECSPCLALHMPPHLPSTSRRCPIPVVVCMWDTSLNRATRVRGGLSPELWRRGWRTLQPGVF